MPVFSSKSMLDIQAGCQNSVTVSTTPTDVNLTGCTITMSNGVLQKIGVLFAWVELRCRGANTFAGANNFGNCSLKISPDGGSNWYTSVGLNNTGSFLAIQASPIAPFAIVGTNNDVSSYVNAAIASGTDLTFQITGAVAAQNNMILEDVMVVLHMLIA